MRESENAFRPRTYLDVDLVTTQHDRNVLADSLQVSVPVGNVLVGDSGSDVEHDDTTLSCGRGKETDRRVSAPVFLEDEAGEEQR